ncbi:hypothetical protein BT96DRAFT_994801 [Gymnopus androsaceus JB14]|uniref:Uncharacterized protein n=1 Tax=Gymnopus androsaceus JB14 TaxID=1447944 RepID=A0A6A4HI48_9AGAR|nr:hypothetical protein BT96DRAFT_994801 [Gymnopus androsaceus JB14]
MSVKVHTHGSNRQQPNQAEKKVVFKGVLDNPFRIHWPSVPVNLQNVVLAQILSLLDGVSQYQDIKSQANRKRKREQKQSRPRKKKKTQVEATTNGSDNPATAASESGSGATEMQVDLVVPDPPAILAHLTTGINQVTKRLETQMRNRRGTTTDETASSPPNIKIVLVCRADVNPPMLIDHLPHLVAAYNSARAPDPIILVPLPQGAEFTLAEVLGGNAPGLSTILSLVTSISILSASWLSSQVTVAESRRSTPIIPTHIKQLRTTAPKDMKAAKEKRAAGRAAAKEKKKNKAVQNVK